MTQLSPFELPVEVLGRSTGGHIRTVTSRDGTPIAFWRGGSGPSLLLVHGATYDHTTAWRFVVPELERQFTVYAMDRRGRGGSGDSPAYELQHEAEDVAAVVTPTVLSARWRRLCSRRIFAG
jgi:pimeloyl-ACP methyl ester carboxylesterase